MNDEKPFVKLLRSPNFGYFFDVNKNEIVQVDDDVFSCINALLKNEEIHVDEHVKECIEELKSQGYLSSNKVKEIKHPMTDYVGTMLERNMQKITLQLTQNCNFRCSYCPYSQSNGIQRGHANKNMPIEIAKKAIIFLREHSVDCDKVSVGFYGGEPLLEFELLKEIVFFAEKELEGKDYSFTITTNVSLLNDEIVEFFIAHSISLVISIDGPKKIHDKNRVFAESGNGTFDTVVKKLEHINEKYPEFFKKIMGNMVIDPSNSFDEINSLYENNSIFNKISIQSSALDDITSDQKNTYSPQFLEENRYNTFLAYLVALGRIPREAISSISYQHITYMWDAEEKMVSQTRLMDISAPGGPCMPGVLRMLVDINGNFLPCERVSEVSDPMLIGNIEDGVDLEKVRNLLNIGALTSDICRNCWAFMHCKLCCKHADTGDQLSGEEKSKHCNGVRESFYTELREFILMQEVHKEYQV